MTNLRHRTGVSAGFTLVELMVVLSIAGLLVALVPPLYSQVVPGARLRTFTHDFAASLRGARSRAVVSNRQIDVRVIADPPSYAVADGHPVRLPRGVQMTAFEYSPNQQQTLVDAHAITGRAVSIRFYADGSSNGALIKVAGGSTAYRVDVSWLLGETRISEAEGDDH